MPLPCLSGLVAACMGGLSEECSSVPFRLCLKLPFKICLHRLSVAFGIYHSIKRDAVFSSVIPPSAALVQSRAVGFAKSLAATLQ